MILFVVAVTWLWSCVTFSKTLRGVGLQSERILSALNLCVVYLRK